MLKVLIILIAIIAAPIATFMYYRSGATMDGTIIDCQTGQPVGGAAIRARQFGWGYDQYLVWDKAYTVTTTSEPNGYFSMRVAIREPAEIKVTRENYIDAIEYREPGNQVKLKLLAGNPATFQKPSGYIVYTKDCAVQ